MRLIKWLRMPSAGLITVVVIILSSLVVILYLAVAGRIVAYSR